MMMMKVDWNVSHFLAAHLKKSTANSTFLVPIFFQVRSVIPEVLAARRPCFKWNTPLQKLALRCWNPKGWCKALGRPWPLDVKHGSWWFSWWFFMVISWWFHSWWWFSWWFREGFMVISWWFPMEFIQASLCPGFIAASGGRVTVLEQFAVAGGLSDLATLQLELFQTSAALAAADAGLPKPAAGGNHVERWNQIQQNIWWDVDGCWLYDDVIVCYCSILIVILIVMFKIDLFYETCVKPCLQHVQEPLEMNFLLNPESLRPGLGPIPCSADESFRSRSEISESAEVDASNTLPAAVPRWCGTSKMSVEAKSWEDLNWTLPIGKLT